jgi:hypothetical protein
MPRWATRNRVKVSATLAPELIARVREYQREAGLPTFSAALEEVLWRQLMAEREKAYYLSMTAEERGEQEAWATFATEQFFKVNREG